MGRRAGLSDWEIQARQQALEPFRLQLHRTYTYRFSYGINLFSGEMLTGSDAIAWLRLQFLKQEEDTDNGLA